MASLVLTGDTSGQVTIAAPAVAGTNTLTLLAATATNSVNTLGTAVASTSGTSITFSSLPAWIKKITVMFSGVSTNGTSPMQVQIGDSGGIENTGYTSASQTDGASSGNLTTGFAVFYSNVAASLHSGSIQISSITGTTWVASGVLANTGGNASYMAGSKALSDVLTQVRITTVNGTDTFDAGSINILYEG